MMAAVCHAGSFSDKQMEKFVKFLKKGKYNDASAVLVDKMDLSPEMKTSTIATYAGHIQSISLGHGKLLNYTTLRTKRLSKSFEDTVYQINCEKSSWLVMIREYVAPSGKSFFSGFRLLTEEDVFTYYEK